MLVLLVSGGLAGAVYWWKSGLLQSEKAVSWKYLVLLLVLAGHFGLVAAVSWQFSVGAGGNPDNLLSHSTYTASIARGNFPVVNPYKPDQLLTYRLTFHLLGAFATRLADQSAPEVLTWLYGVLFAFLFLGVNGLGRAFCLGPWRTLLAASVLMAVSDLRWVRLWESAGLEDPAFNNVALVLGVLAEVVGVALTNTYINVSLVYGFLVVVCVMALYLFTLRTEGKRRTILALATGVTLGYLAAAAESWFAALAAVLCIDVGARFLLSKRFQYADGLRIASAASAMALFAVISPGILFARVFGGVDNDLGLAFRGNRLFHVPPGLVYGKAEWVPLMESDFLWFMVVVVCLFVLAFIYVWQSNDHVAWLFLLFSAVCFGTFLLLTVYFAHDMWRFAQAGTASLAFVSGLAAGWYFSQALLGMTLVKRLASVLLVIVTFVFTFGFALYSLAVPWLADPRPPATYRLDVEAVKEFLTDETEVEERILVLGGADRWTQHPGVALDRERRWLSALVVAYSGQFYPSGALFADSFGPTSDSPHIQRVSAAQGRLSAADLQALDITYLYAAEPWLTQVHRAALAEKLERGSFLRVWRTEDTAQPRACRVFLRLNESVSDAVTAVTFREDERVALPSAPLRLQLPLLHAAADASGKTSTKDDIAQASILIAVSEPTTVRVENGSGYALRMPVDEALVVRTPPLESDTTLEIHTEYGVAQVLWIEAYPPIGLKEAVYLPENLELCGVYE